MNKFRLLLLVAALSMQTVYFPNGSGGTPPAAPPPLPRHEIPKPVAMPGKRRRKALKGSRTLQGGIHGAKLTRVVFDELVGL